MRKLLVALVVLPLAALAQGDAASKPGPGGPREPDQARMEKRMRLARTLGLAEALDLDTAQALKLGDTLSRFDDRRKAIRNQAHDARDALRRAAANEKASAAEVDAAVGKLVDARTQLTAVDREMLQAVTQGLTPDRKARAALFLGRFHDRVERRVMMFGPGQGGQGPEMRGPGMRGPGMPGMRGPGMRGPDAKGEGEQGMSAGPSGDRWAARMPEGLTPGGDDAVPFFDEDEAD
jgi:Spy/CpxP family protein refolding chaperone